MDWLLILVLFVAIFVSLTIGARVAWTLTGISLIFCFLLWGTNALNILVRNVCSTGFSETFICIPLFVFVGFSLRYSGMIEEMFDAAQKWLGGLGGGLAIGTMLVCIAFAAISAGSGVTVVLIGLVAMPSMLRRGYDNKMVMGSISAGAVLGIVIPPSIPMVLLALFAQISLGSLFFAGVVPGIMCGLAHCSYIGIRCALNPKLGPPISLEEKVGWKEKLISLRAIVLPLFLIVGVLGSIWTGVCTPSEASGLGALGACMILAIKRRMTWAVMQESLTKTLNVTLMVFWVLVGAFCFINIYSYLGAIDLICTLLANVPGGSYSVLAVMMVVMFVSGMIMDDYALIILLAPLFFPLVRGFGWDPLWFGIVFILNIQMAYLTPPYGFNLFYLRAITPESVSMVEIYRSVIPFVIVQVLVLIIVIKVPILATWLPSLMI